MGFLKDEHIEATCPSASPPLYMVIAQPMHGGSMAIMIQKGLAKHVSNGGAAGRPSVTLASAIDDADFNPEDWLPDAEGGHHCRQSWEVGVHLRHRLSADTIACTGGDH